MKLRKRFLLMMFLLIAIIASGCGGNKTDSSKKDSDDGKKTEVTKSAEKKSGGEIKIALTANIASLDPASYTSLYESNVMRSIYEPLVTYNKDLSKIVPLIAKSWSVSDDNLKYTFVIKDNVFFHKGKFQDGRQLTAEDVKYSLLRSLNDSAMNRIRYISDIEVLSDTELVITLDRPYAAFLTMLTDTGNSIVCKEEVEGQGKDFVRNPVGTGPFVFDEWQADSFVRVVRNDKYHGNTPLLDSAKFTFVTDANMMGNAIQAGDIDIATGISGQNVQLIKNNENLELVQIQGLSIGYFSFNLRRGPTAELKVRQAMNLALNRDELTAGVYKYGEAKPGYLPLPRASWGYSKKAEDIVRESSGGSDEQIEKAKSLMAEAGYADGFDLDLYVSAARVPAATIFQAHMSKIGVNINIKTAEWGTFSETVSKGNAPSYIMGWSWYADPDFFLYQMLSSLQIGALGNGGGYKNEDVDKYLFDAVSTTVDQEERAAIYEKALVQIAKDLPHLDLYDQDIIVGMNKDVKGFVVRPDQTIYLTTDEINVWLDR